MSVTIYKMIITPIAINNKNFRQNFKKFCTEKRYVFPLFRKIAFSIICQRVFHPAFVLTIYCFEREFGVQRRF